VIVKILCVGAGLTGSVIARNLADRGFPVTVIDERDHIAGNCFSQRDTRTGIMVHTYGPHIFHTSNKSTWDYVNRFAEFSPYINRIKAVVNGKVYPLPINLLTINQFFNRTFSPAESKKFLENHLADKNILNPESFEEHALQLIGRELYEAFIKGYTIKQWGIHPRELSASILKRLPVRFNYEDNYFSDPFQGIPNRGYTDLVKNVLDSDNIRLKLNTGYEDIDSREYNHIFYSGRIDRFFKYRFGELSYRTLDFKNFYPASDEAEDYQGCSIINFCDENVPYTRIVEHKHFAPFEIHRETICTQEFSRACKQNDIPFYPVLYAGGNNILNQYLAESKKETSITFVGRLGTHQYLDMDTAVTGALLAVDNFLKTL
jgi:UDP-galactopyranose mutase